MRWQIYWKWLWRSLAALAAFVMASIWIVDPYGNLPFSPPFDRTAMATNQRYSYPAIARDARFDSAVIGTSTSRLLRPKALDAAMGGHFVNLSMNSATAYEQSRIFEVFTTTHDMPKSVIIGLDAAWCEKADKPTKFTFRRFPQWMYDSKPWNDILHILEFKTFEILGKQVGFLLGLKKAKYGHDGYADFLPSDDEYDLAKVQKGLYGGAKPMQNRAPSVAVSVTDQEREGWNYPNLELLRSMLAVVPVAARKVLVFVPYHYSHQPVPGSVGAAISQECKDRITRIAGSYSNTVVLDFMIFSPITKTDENYWDFLHFTRQTSERLVQFIAVGAQGMAAPNGEYSILADTVTPPQK